jgi:hypothetical protein
MRPERTERLVEGDTLVSPSTVPAWQPLKIAEISRHSNRVWVRIPALQKQTQIAGGWMLATSLYRAPVGATWDKTKRQWVRDGRPIAFGQLAAEVIDDTAPEPAPDF